MRIRTSLLVGCIAALSLFACRKSTSGARALQCKTALLETTSCRGEDTSFQECHYFFRAEGKPDPEVCRAFMQAPASDAKTSGCDERSPLGWNKIACKDYRLSADDACFTCTSARPEESRHLVQAFSTNCERATVLKSCNADLARAVTE